MYKPTTALKKIQRLTKRIKGLQGGTSASKTISGLMVEIDYAQRHKPENATDLTSIVSESMPHLKKGIMRDFEGIMKSHGYWKEANWNKTDKIYTFETGWQIEFFSVDQSDKVRGPRRRRLFGNECNNWKNGKETFDQLEVRTIDSITLDWNPSAEFWWHTDILTNSDLDAEMLILTYKDNEALDDQIVKSIEARRHNKAWWTVYGLGQLGEVEEKVYKGWTTCREIPEGARLERIGLDYGYTNDPTAIIEVYKYNSGYVLHERLYRKGMSNKDIADFVNGFNTNQVFVVADSAEPKSNDELASYGVTLMPASKGPGSIMQGIQLVQSMPIIVTESSTNLLKEYRGYVFDKDKDGHVINKPIDFANHGMDALRYAIQSLHPHDAQEEESLELY